jgi:hypothetical protein
MLKGGPVLFRPEILGSSVPLLSLSLRLLCKCFAAKPFRLAAAAAIICGTIALSRAHLLVGAVGIEPDPSRERSAAELEQATGLPAPAFDAVSRDEIPREQERV